MCEKCVNIQTVCLFKGKQLVALYTQAMYTCHNSVQFCNKNICTENGVMLNLFCGIFLQGIRWDTKGIFFCVLNNSEKGFFENINPLYCTH